MGNGGSRALFRTMIFVCFILFLFVGILENHTTEGKTMVTVSWTRIFKHRKLTGKERHHFHEDLILNYVSKRRVPNGPDPIHNRRAVKTRQPPGRS